MLPAKQHLDFLKDRRKYLSCQCFHTWLLSVPLSTLFHGCLSFCMRNSSPPSDKPCGPVSLGFTHHSLVPDTERTVPLGEAFARLLHGLSLRCPCSPLPCSRSLGKPAPTYSSLIHACLRYPTNVTIPHSLERSHQTDP